MGKMASSVRVFAESSLNDTIWCELQRRAADATLLIVASRSSTTIISPRGWVGCARFLSRSKPVSLPFSSFLVPPASPCDALVHGVELRLDHVAVLVVVCRL